LEEASTPKLRSWKRYLSVKVGYQLIAIVLRGLLIFGVLFFSGCIKHPHGHYEDHKIIIPMTEIVENITIVDELTGIELLNENASRITKMGSMNHQYSYENTIYFDRLVYVSEVVIHHDSSALINVQINDEEESRFISKTKKSVNKVNVKILISSDAPSDVIYMDMKTIRDPNSKSDWQSVL